MATISAHSLAWDYGRRVREAYFAPDWVHDNLISGQYAWVVSRLREYLPTPGRILDFGAGGADISAIAAMMGHAVEAADDLNDSWHLEQGGREKIVRFAERFGVKYTILGGPEAGPLPWARDHFDMVMLHHVLEHFPDSPRPLLNELLARTRTGGLLFITVPNAGNLRKRLALLTGGTNLPRYGEWYWAEGHYRGHFREHVRSDLTDMCRYLGIEPVEIATFHSMLHVVPRRLRAVYKAVTALAPGVRDTWSLVARKPEGWMPRNSPGEGDMPFRHDPRE